SAARIDELSTGTLIEPFAVVPRPFTGGEDYLAGELLNANVEWMIRKEVGSIDLVLRIRVLRNLRNNAFRPLRRDHCQLHLDENRSKLVPSVLQRRVYGTSGLGAVDDLQISNRRNRQAVLCMRAGNFLGCRRKSVVVRKEERWLFLDGSLDSLVGFRSRLKK